MRAAAEQRRPLVARRMSRGSQEASDRMRRAVDEPEELAHPHAEHHAAVQAGLFRHLGAACENHTESLQGMGLFLSDLGNQIEI